MDFADTPEEATFRHQCAEWLDNHAQPKVRPTETYGKQLSSAEYIQAARDWQATKASAGYGAITWPQALGGLGGTAIQEVIYREEEKRYNVPTGVFNISLGMVLPSLMQHASRHVLGQHAAPALYGETLWCQLLSEPDAGSDLGRIRCRAQRADDGRDGWLINGQKVWTSLAQFADYGLVLTRTNPDVSKFKGMTVFYVAMNSPGIEIRPIRQANGKSEFNEVFLNDVFVSDQQRVGEVDHGWRVTLTGLMNERLSIGGVMPAELWRIALGLIQRGKDSGQTADTQGHLRQRLANLYYNTQGLWLLQCRGLTSLSQGRQPGPELSAAKITAAQTVGEFASLAMDSRGTAGILAEDKDDGDDDRLVNELWFGSAAMRIAGGTDEIVRNSIGERVLGLPPEPGEDKNTAFKDLQR